MKNTKVLIMEDQVAEASYLSETLSELGYEVPAVATSLSDGLELFAKFQPDICLLDIYLNGRPDGIAFATELQALKKKQPFMFLTGATDTATFRLAKASRPWHYLVKPFNKAELEFAIELTLEQFRNEDQPALPKGNAADHSVFVKRGNSLVNLRYDEIKYIEVEGKYSKIISNDQKFVVQQSLSDLHAMLPATQFLRVHRNYVVNSKEITKIDTQSHEVFFRDGNNLFFSHRYLDEFMKAFTLIK